MKTLLKIVGGIIILLIAFFIALNIYFSDSRLKKMVVPRLSEAIGRPVNIDHISLSFFKMFPNPAIAIDSLSIPGKARSDTLLSLKELTMGVKLIPLLSSRVVVTDMNIDKPTFTYIVYPDGSTNIDFLYSGNSTETDTASSGYAVSIPHFHIRDGHFGYIDSTMQIRAIIENLDGNMSLTYTDSITSRLRATVGQLNVSYAGKSYISGLPLSLRESLTLYTEKELLKFKKGHLSIHGLKMDLTGIIKNWSQVPKIKFQFNSSSNDFGNLLKLLPESYKQYTSDFKTKGSLALSGTIKGKISEDQIPSFNIKMAVRNGYLKDPDLPKPIKNIRFSARATNQLITVDTLHVSAGRNELSGSGRLKDPLGNNSAYRAGFLADVDLSTVHRFYDLSQIGIEKLSGQLNVNASIKGRLGQPNDVLFSGKAVLSNGLIKFDEVPKTIAPVNININGSQELLHIRQFDLNAGPNSISVRGTVSNIADEAHRRVNFNVSMKADLSTFQKFYPVGGDSLQLQGILTAGVKLRGSAAEIGQAIQSGSLKLTNGAITGRAVLHPVRNLSLKLKLSPDKAVLKTLKATIGSSDIEITGSLTYYMSFLKGAKHQKEIPTLTGHFSSNFLYLDELMPQSSGDTTSFYPQLPYLNTRLSADVNRLKIAGVTMRNLKVQARTTPSKVHLSNASVQLFGGSASGKMIWKIPEGKPSTFHFEGSLDSLQLKPFFKQFIILGKNSTFYKYISGSFSAQANYTTKIDTTLIPIIRTSKLNSSFRMSQARVSGHPIQKKLVQFTHIQKLKSLTLDSWTSHISIKNSILTLKNLSITSDNIGMELNGTENLMSGLIDFNVSLHLPSKFQNTLGTILNGRIAALLAQPDGSFLIPLELTGQYSDPEIRLDMSYIKNRLKKIGKHKAKNALKNLFNRFINKSNSTDKGTAKADTSKMWG